MIISQKAATICRRALAAGLVITALFAAGQPIRAENTFREGLARAAADIVQLLKENNLANEVSVGEFTGPPTKDTSAGPGIARVLTEELRRLGIQIATPAPLIRGEYRGFKVKETKAPFVRVLVNVEDASGKSLGKSEYDIFGEAEVGTAMGYTAAIPPRGDQKARTGELDKADDRPHFLRAGRYRTQITPRKGCPYSIEVLVGRTKDGPWRARKPANKGGQAFVKIRRGEFYRIRLFNRSPYEAAARISIDGLNMFSFSKVKSSKGKKYSQVIVGRHKPVEIKGWHITNDESNSFVVTKYANSAAAKLLKSGAKTGTITVTFAAAWPKDQERPPDEPARSSSKSAGDDGTGLGPRVEAKFKEAQRNIGVVRAIVSVRYSKTQ